MSRNLLAYRDFQVFLNYPYDDRFESLEYALHFPVGAAGLLPVCAKDLTVPDRPRLEILVDAIRNCRYSAHELSRSTGEGTRNLSRMNMPIEMGMAIFFALDSQRRDHRCTFFVPTANDFKIFASDLAGLDPQYHNNDPFQLVTRIYDWLRSVVPSGSFNSVPTNQVVIKFKEFNKKLKTIRGSGQNGKPSHEETRELMYQMCSEVKWWDWRNIRAGLQEIPVIPIDWKQAT
jgi:hypothetical protein